MTKGECVDEQSRQRPEYGSYRTCLIALLGLISVLTAAAVNVSVDGWRPQLGALSSESGVTACARLILTLGGMFAVGCAISIQPGRVALLGLACVTALVARKGFHPAWDSGRMLAGFAAIVAGIAALLMALPRPARRVGVSLLVLFHFVGIFSQVSWHSYEGLPWFNEAADVYVYRPYLEFVYLTAGYHYYGGDPGPSDLFWFCIKYNNGDTRWFKLPRRPKDMSDPLGLECQRRYLLAYQAAGIASMKEIPKETMSSRDAMSANIPWHPYISHENQYQPPNSAVRTFLLPSYVRHVALMPSNQHGDVRSSIKSIKVYRVAHAILSPNDVANVGFNDPPTYMPYFLGEFDSEGKLINENDSMWGWLVPIFHRPKSANVPGCHTARTFPAEFELVDGLRIHAGSNYAD